MINFKEYCKARITKSSYPFEYEDEDSVDEYLEDVDNWAELANELVNNPNEHNNGLLEAKFLVMLDDAVAVQHEANQKLTLWKSMEAMRDGRHRLAKGYLELYHTTAKEYRAFQMGDVE